MRQPLALLLAPCAALLFPMAQALQPRAAPLSKPKPKPQAKQAPRAKHVFIVSFDGGKPSVMKASRMPITMRLANRGARTWTARTVVPSITLPSHTSMLTGLPIAQHEITWNDYQPDRGVVKVPTIFGLARARGLKTALFAGKEKFKHLNVPGTLNAFAVPGYNCQKVAAQAAAYIEKSKPNLCFVHFADSDGAGHEFGWGSPQQVKAFEDEDKALGVLVRAIDKAGIRAQSVIILSADHGGHDKTHGSDRDEDVQIPWIASGRGVKNSNISVPVSTMDTAATALWLLGIPRPGGMKGKPVASAFVAR